MLTTILQTQVFLYPRKGKTLLKKRTVKPWSRLCRGCRISVPGDAPHATVQGPRQPSSPALSRRPDQLTFRGPSQPALCYLCLKPNSLSPVCTYELDLLLPYRHGAALFLNYRRGQFVETKSSLSKPVLKATESSGEILQKEH